ncbi:hypothetical protein [Flexivirga caeni]|uniref:hypothetical protein n=1 Tax=Flexivirga caeni TaxID=2294115 RepID=UPI0011CEA527|nr:hypothetical protein [Flexivirga caeni]
MSCSFFGFALGGGRAFIHEDVWRAPGRTGDAEIFLQSSRSTEAGGWSSQVGQNRAMIRPVVAH